MSSNLIAVSWNVEGLTEDKLLTLQTYMHKYNIDLICLQESHRPKSDYYVTDNGYLVILSGAAGSCKEYAGVGFVVAPWIRRSVIGFCQYSNRLASLKLRVPGGKAVFFSAYAPHSGKSFDERQSFFQSTAEIFSKTSSHGPKYLLGDWNARLYQRLPGEEHVVGPHVFSNPYVQVPDGSNRNLLVEFCTGAGLEISNTFHEVDPENQVTCYAVGHTAMGDISWQSHSQIDMMLCPRSWSQTVQAIWSDRTIPLASHHFPVFFKLGTVVLPVGPTKRPNHPCHDALGDPLIANRYATFFDQCMEDSVFNDTDDLSSKYAALLDSFEAAAKATLPRVSARAKKPWISTTTLALIDARIKARSVGDKAEESNLNANIKQCVKRDRSSWLHGLLATGDWSQIRKMRKGFVPQQGRLKDSEGCIVSSERRAETLADHLEKVQWAVRHVTSAVDRGPIHAELPANVDEITADEVIAAVKKLKRNRAHGTDLIPPEYWKTILVDGSTASKWAIQFCQQCWRQKGVPDQWHEARVAEILKKGDPSDCNNYRPISLLQIGYKLFAQIILSRLVDAGAEDRLWKTQFGFRSGRGTNDALFVARRALEHAWAIKDGKVIMLALDWAKAFDSVSPAALSSALRRLGIPDAFIKMIEAIYSQRKFIVQDAGHRSEWHPQHFGISQGCPLSPFLFVMMMTVLLHDAKEKVVNETGARFSRTSFVNELVYADDTLLIDVDTDVLHAFMTSIGEAGAEYGLAFNWAKLEMLPVRTHAVLRKPDGEIVNAKERMVYLGSTLAADGKIGSELNRRLGLARNDFDKLKTIWSHSGLPTWRKIAIFDACVVSKLLYSLHTACLNKVERRRIDGLHARCLRSIMRVAPAFYSRVSNATVFRWADSKTASFQLSQQQLLYLGKIARRDQDDPARACIFKPGTLELRELDSKRRVGRPRLEWGSEVQRRAVQLAGSSQELNDILMNHWKWRRLVRSYVQ